MIQETEREILFSDETRSYYPIFVQCYETFLAISIDEEAMEKGSKNPDHLPSQVKCKGEGTRVRWAARLEADERISRVSLNTRRTSSRLLLARRVCVGVPWRTSRGKANRLHTHTRSRDRRESPHYRATRSTHSPFLSSYACPFRLFFFAPFSFVLPTSSFVSRSLFVLSQYFWKFFIRFGKRWNIRIILCITGFEIYFIYVIVIFVQRGICVFQKKF